LLLEEFDEFGAKLIHYACALNLHEMICVLHEFGCNLDAKVLGKNLTPILIATICNHQETIKVLNDLGI
jgi:ankyrin repeat protein